MKDNFELIKTGVGDRRIISFKRKGKSSCKHDSVFVDSDKWCIECADCGELLDPIAYLVKLSYEESFIEMRADAMERQYIELTNKINRRKFTKCEHCGKMTRITGV